MLSIYELFIIFLPMLSGYLTSMFCRIESDAGSKVWFRPPPIVFSIVWPILYLFLGISWFFALNEHWLTNISYLILIFLLSLWIYFYSCEKDKKTAIYILSASCVLSLLLCVFVSNFYSKILAIPLLLWLVFATIINIYEVKYTDL